MRVEAPHPIILHVLASWLSDTPSRCCRAPSAWTGLLLRVEALQPILVQFVSSFASWHVATFNPIRWSTLSSMRLWCASNEFTQFFLGLLPKIETFIKPTLSGGFRTLHYQSWNPFTSIYLRLIASSPRTEKDSCFRSRSMP